VDPYLEAFRQGLRELGYVEGQNIAFESRSAEGKYERLPALAADLVRMNVDVVVTSAPPAATAAKQATSTIPIVFTSAIARRLGPRRQPWRGPAATSPAWP
jgi:putative ABC transport system substrate-binding protein